MKLIKQFSLYTFVGFFSAGINFFLMPYLSHYILPAEYGILSMINSLVTILIPLVGLVASGLIYVEYYKTKDREAFSSLFTSIQLIPLVPTLVLLLLAMAFPLQLAGFFEIPPEKTYWIYLSVVLAGLSIYSETLLSYAIIEQKPINYLFFVLSKLFLEVGLTILFVSHYGLGWEGRLLSWLIATIFSSGTAFFYFRYKNLLSGKIQWKYIVAGLSFGIPLILHTIGKFVINQSDRIFIAKMISLEEAGIYNIGYQVGMVLLLLVSAASNFFQPFLYERLAHPNQESGLQIVRLSYIILAGLFVFLLLLTFLAPPFFSWLVDKRYIRATAYVFWVGLSYFFWGIYLIFSGFLFYAKKTAILGRLAILNVVLNLILNYFLIQWFGALGAAYATCISFFIIALVIVWKVYLLYPMPWRSFGRIVVNYSDDK